MNRNTPNQWVDWSIVLLPGGRNAWKVSPCLNPPTSTYPSCHRSIDRHPSIHRHRSPASESDAGDLRLAALVNAHTPQRFHQRRQTHWRKKNTLYKVTWHLETHCPQNQTQSGIRGPRPLIHSLSLCHEFCGALCGAGDLDSPSNELLGVWQGLLDSDVPGNRVIEQSCSFHYT